MKSLPIEPFREWLSERVERHGYAEVALRLDKPERSLYRILHQAQSVGFDLVDKALADWDGADSLTTLYPLPVEPTDRPVEAA